MANPKQTQTQALTDWLWSKLWVDLAQLPAEEKKASAKKMRGGLHVLRSAFLVKNTHAASDLWTSISKLLPSVRLKCVSEVCVLKVCVPACLRGLLRNCSNPP